jgi:hypothetical protein
MAGAGDPAVEGSDAKGSSSGMKLHRSLVFWAGVMVMISVCWAWWDSRRNLAVVAGGRHMAVSAGSGLSICSWDEPGFMYERDTLAGDLQSLREVGWRWPVYHRNTGPEWQEGMTSHFLLPLEGSAGDPLEPLLLHAVLGPRGSWVLYLPYWLMALMVMLSWGSLLGWRWRRMRRAEVVVMEGGEG